MSKTTSFMRTALLAGAVAMGSVGIAANAAQAGGVGNFKSLNSHFQQSQVLNVGHRHRKFKGGFRFKRHKGFHGCGFYKWKWHQTGLFFWKKKYFICKGWW
ncbi:MAG: hypothetical protein K0U74_09230 [Alphaproteobacteria bacterium]|nr:hypothetical protein [Alphaproteobacteria bacterium]